MFNCDIIWTCRAPSDSFAVEFAMFSESYHLILVSCILFVALFLTFAIFAVVVKIWCDAMRPAVNDGLTICIMSFLNQWIFIVIYDILFWIVIFKRFLKHSFDDFHNDYIKCFCCGDVVRIFLVIDWFLFRRNQSMTKNILTTSPQQKKN